MKTEFSSRQLSEPSVAVSAQAIRKCVHCGFCTATCPTYVLLGDERDSPRGRIYLIKEMLEKEQQPTPQVVKHIDRCLSCLACVTTCPSGVDYMHLIDHARAYVNERFSRPLSERLLRWTLAKILPYQQRMIWAMRLGRAVHPLRGVMKRLGANRYAALLQMASDNRPKRVDVNNALAKGQRRGRVLLQQGCAEPVLRSNYRAATVRLLTRIGYDVEFAAGEGCCGALVHHMGREAQALGFVRRNVDAWTRAIGDSDVAAIIVTASGCGTTIKDYGFLLRNDVEYAQRAARISALAKDIGEFVTPDDVRSEGAERSLHVAYHAPCSLQHGQKLHTVPRLLEAAGFRVSIPAEAHLCCGSAGTYNILQPEIAAQLGKRKASHLSNLGGNLDGNLGGNIHVDAIATGNVGCAVQIGAYTATPIVHVVELLDWALGGQKPSAID